MTTCGAVTLPELSRATVTRRRPSCQQVGRCFLTTVFSTEGQIDDDKVGKKLAKRLMGNTACGSGLTSGERASRAKAKDDMSLTQVSSKTPLPKPRASAPGLMGPDLLDSKHTALALACLGMWWPHDPIMTALALAMVAQQATDRSGAGIKSTMQWATQEVNRLHACRAEPIASDARTWLLRQPFLTVLPGADQVVLDSTRLARAVLRVANSQPSTTSTACRTTPVGSTSPLPTWPPTSMTASDMQMLHLQAQPLMHCIVRVLDMSAAAPVRMATLRLAVKYLAGLASPESVSKARSRSSSPADSKGKPTAQTTSGTSAAAASITNTVTAAAGAAVAAKSARVGVSEMDNSGATTAPVAPNSNYALKAVQQLDQTSLLEPSPLSGSTVNSSGSNSNISATVLASAVTLIPDFSSTPTPAGPLPLPITAHQLNPAKRQASPQTNAFALAKAGYSSAPLPTTTSRPAPQQPLPVKLSRQTTGSADQLKAMTATSIKAREVVSWARRAYPASDPWRELKLRAVELLAARPGNMMDGPKFGAYMALAVPDAWTAVPQPRIQALCANDPFLIAAGATTSSTANVASLSVCLDVDALKQVANSTSKLRTSSSGISRRSSAGMSTTASFSGISGSSNDGSVGSESVSRSNSASAKQLNSSKAIGTFASQ